jgi:hypothetical protein
LKAAAQELAEGVLSGAILVHCLVWRLKASHSRVTSPSACEKPPMMKMVLAAKQMEWEERYTVILPAIYREFLSKLYL